MKGHIGFTGTREGMSGEQIRLVHHFLMDALGLGYHTFHHGDCVGADSQAHDLAMCLGYKVVVHPPSNPRLRAYRQGHEEWPEKGYMARNADIVNRSDVLVATPKPPSGTNKGGTWATINLGKGKPVAEIAIFHADGSHRSITPPSSPW